MLLSEPDWITRAEIGFEPYPRGADIEKAQELLRGLEGVIGAFFDPAVQRMTVIFDPTKVSISHILSSLEPLGAKPKVISVAMVNQGLRPISSAL